MEEIPQNRRTEDCGKGLYAQLPEHIDQKRISDLALEVAVYNAVLHLKKYVKQFILDPDFKKNFRDLYYKIFGRIFSGYEWETDEMSDALRIYDQIHTHPKRAEIAEWIDRYLLSNTGIVIAIIEADLVLAEQKLTGCAFRKEELAQLCKLKRVDIVNGTSCTPDETARSRYLGEVLEELFQTIFNDGPTFGGGLKKVYIESRRKLRKILKSVGLGHIETR